jgi:hypothetical protein
LQVAAGRGSDLTRADLDPDDALDLNGERVRRVAFLGSEQADAQAVTRPHVHSIGGLLRQDHLVGRTGTRVAPRDEVTSVEGAPEVGAWHQKCQLAGPRETGILGIRRQRRAVHRLDDRPEQTHRCRFGY